MEKTNVKKAMDTKKMVKISILGAIGALLMFFDFSTWFAPPFLKLDISDIPALLGSFAMGPVAGIIVQLIKNLLKLVLQGTGTGGVGELSNFIVGSAFAFTAGFIYSKNKTFKTAILGLIVGGALMVCLSTLSNYFVIFPLYSKILNLPIEELVKMGNAVNSRVVDLKTLIVFAVVPFNILKCTMNSIITILIYKKVSPILRG